MIPARPIVERLKAEGFPKVEGVLEWAGMKAAPAFSPTLFVIPAQEAAAANETSGGIHDQRVATMFRVVILMRPSSRVEGAASDELEQIERRVIDAIAGWHHPDAVAGAVCNYAGGRLLSADGHPIAWASDFNTAWRLRKGQS